MEEREKCIVCEGTDELLKAVNEHPKAILHLSKRQIRRLGQEIAKAHFNSVVAGFNKYSTNFYINEDGSICLKRNTKFPIRDVLKDLESDVTNQVIRELNPVIETNVNELVSKWLSAGGLQAMITNEVSRVMRDCGNKIIEAALRVKAEE